MAIYQQSVGTQTPVPPFPLTCGRPAQIEFVMDHLTLVSANNHAAEDLVDGDTFHIIHLTAPILRLTPATMRPATHAICDLDDRKDPGDVTFLF